jgi:hypothetical protein
MSEHKDGPSCVHEIGLRRVLWEFEATVFLNSSSLVMYLQPGQLEHPKSLLCDRLLELVAAFPDLVFPIKAEEVVQA